MALKERREKVYQFPDSNIIDMLGATSGEAVDLAIGM